MSKDHTNIDTTKPYEMLDGKCESDYTGKSYKEVNKGEVENLDMGNAPYVNRSNNGKKEKSY